VRDRRTGDNPAGKTTTEKGVAMNLTDLSEAEERGWRIEHEYRATKGSITLRASHRVQLFLLIEKAEGHIAVSEQASREQAQRKGQRDIDKLLQRLIGLMDEHARLWAQYEKRRDLDALTGATKVLTKATATARELEGRRHV
jgi:hypothetical protein